MTDPRLDASEQVHTYWWMWPARHIELIRPGLRAATDADARRLRQLPGIVGLLLPAAAILIPLLASAAHATTAAYAQGDPYDPWTLLIYDVFTESVPFMLAGLAVLMHARPFCCGAASPGGVRPDPWGQAGQRRRALPGWGTCRFHLPAVPVAAS